MEGRVRTSAALEAKRILQPSTTPNGREELCAAWSADRESLAVADLALALRPAFGDGFSFESNSRLALSTAGVYGTTEITHVGTVLIGLIAPAASPFWTPIGVRDANCLAHVFDGEQHERAVFLPAKVLLANDIARALRNGKHVSIPVHLTEDEHYYHIVYKATRQVTTSCSPQYELAVHSYQDTLVVPTSTEFTPAALLAKLTFFLEKHSDLNEDFVSSSTAIPANTAAFVQAPTSNVCCFATLFHMRQCAAGKTDETTPTGGNDVRWAWSTWIARAIQQAN